jgi:DNA-binding transcriptional ArsR family regulator
VSAYAKQPDPAVVLDALGDATRRRVLELVRESGSAPVGVIAEAMPVSRPAVSQHLRVLEGAGLVTCTKRGTRHLYAVQPDGLAALRLWLDGFWDEALLRFKRAAEGSEGE